jgi:transposase
LVATERDAARRERWRQETRHLDPRRFVVVDETSTSIALTRHYAWAPKNERAHGSIPRNHGVPTTLVAAMTSKGLGPAMTRQGPIDTAAFVAYVEHVLGPHLEPGQIVLLDNLSAHKSDRVRTLIAERHCQLLYLPPYSPDFSPIELAFSKLKDSLRQAAARTQEALDAAIRLSLDQITSHDARHFFSHCDYHLPAES